MEKTIEEIEASVIAELASIRDTVGYRGLRTFDWIAVEVVEFSTFAVGVYTANYAVSLTDKIDPILLRLLYSGLGLEKRDALEAAREKIATLEQQLEEAANVKLEGMKTPAWAMLGEFTKFMEEVVDSDVPRTTSWCVRLEDGEEVTLLNIWAATSHDSPITRATELREMLDVERAKSKRWESRAWKILKIVRRREKEQKPKTAAVLRTLREVSEKNEQLVATLRLLKRLASDINYQCSDFRNTVDKECYRALEAYREGKKDE